jgi:hypothetical protein
MQIVVASQTGQRAVSIEDIALNVKISAYLNSSVVTELQKTAALMHQPKFSSGDYRWHPLI